MLAYPGLEVSMALHISGKLIAFGIVITALITAFSAPRTEPVPLFAITKASVPVVELSVEPHATVSSAAREAPGRVTVALGPKAQPSYVVRATGYNSLESQTNSQPFITATGTSTRFGIVAVSRDLLGGQLPYGSLVRLSDLGNFHNGNGVGAFQHLLDSQQVFIVEDTMHPRKTNQIDVWFAGYDEAVRWGVRRVEVEVVRYGRDGPELAPRRATGFNATPILLATR